MKFFLNNLELILSGAGIAVILIVPLIFFPNPAFIWQAATTTAVIIGVLHGVIFWFVRRRQRNVRDQAIKDIKAMLRDIVNNQLTAISLNLMNMEAAQIKRISESIQLISEMINSLSEESLKTWHNKYEEALKSLKSI